MKKLIKVIGVSTILLGVTAACSPDSDVEVDTDTAVKEGSTYNEIFNMSNDEVVATVGDESITWGDIKEGTLRTGILGALNEDIERKLLINAYPVDEEVVEQVLESYESMAEQNDAEANEETDEVPVDFDFEVPSKDQIRYDLAYEEAMKDSIEYTEDDVRAVWEEHFAQHEGAGTFEEDREIVEQNIHNFIGNDVYEVIQELKRNADINIKIEELDATYKEIFLPEVQETQENVEQ